MSAIGPRPTVVAHIKVALAFSAVTLFARANVLAIKIGTSAGMTMHRH
jgi:hypothetical protein